MRKKINSTFYDDYKATVRKDTRKKRRLYSKLKRACGKCSRIIVDPVIPELTGRGKEMSFSYLCLTRAGIIPVIYFEFQNRTGKLIGRSRYEYIFFVDENHRFVVESPFYNRERVLEKLTDYIEIFEKACTGKKPAIIFDKNIDYLQVEGIRDEYFIGYTKSVCKGIKKIVKRCKSPLGNEEIDQFFLLLRGMYI